MTVSPTSGLVTSKAGGTDSFTVVLTSQPAAAVSIPVASTNPLEGIPSTTLLTFDATNWSVPQVVTVTGQNDLMSGNVAYSISLGPTASVDPNYNLLLLPSVSVLNQGMVAPGLLVTPTSGLVTNEAGGTANFRVVLASQPLAPVTVSLASSNAAEGTPSAASLTFDATNWNVAQTVTVTGQDDQVVHGDQAYAINLTAASADSTYNGQQGSVSLTNQERDVAGLVVTPTAGLVTNEAGGTAQFSVALSSQPLAPVTVSLASCNPARRHALGHLTDLRRHQLERGPNRDGDGPGRPHRQRRPGIRDQPHRRQH